MKYVGICGAAGAGKDTVANILCERHGFTKIAFADPMRAIALAIDPIVDIEPGSVLRRVAHRLRLGTEPERIIRYTDAVAEVGYDAAKFKYPEFRRFLQRLGTEAGRDVLGQNFWVDIAMNKARLIQGPVVFTDMRFQNEYEAVRAGGTTMCVTRKGVEVPAGAHASEALWSTFKCRVTFENDGTIEELTEKVDAYMAHIKDPTLPFT